MRALLQRVSIRAFIALILITGVARFIMTLAGLPNSSVNYASMTAVIMAGAVFFGVLLKTHRERLYAAYLLILPYMIVEVSALGYTWASGRATIFHAPEYSLGTSIGMHTIGHLVGGLSWEPLFLFLIMEIIGTLYVGAAMLGSKLTERT
jgi:hypothetical protein